MCEVAARPPCSPSSYSVYGNVWSDGNIISVVNPKVQDRIRSVEEYDQHCCYNLFCEEKEMPSYFISTFSYSMLILRFIFAFPASTVTCST